MNETTQLGIEVDNAIYDIDRKMFINYNKELVIKKLKTKVKITKEIL